jgi:hypothetical protein
VDKTEPFLLFAQELVVVLAAVLVALPAVVLAALLVALRAVALVAIQFSLIVEKSYRFQ